MSLAQACRAGHCTDCGKLIWRYATASRDNGPAIRAGQRFILWPEPSSAYARLETENGYAAGVAFCGEHVPALGENVLYGYGPVIAIESARERYHDRFEPVKELFLRAWLRDALILEPAEIETLVNQWKVDAVRDC